MAHSPGGAPLMPPRYLYLDLPKHVMRNVSRYCLRAHTLVVESSIWCRGNDRFDKCSCAAVKKRDACSFSLSRRFVCSLRRKYTLLFFPFCQSFSMEAPIFHMPCLVRLSLNFFLNSALNSAISFRTSWTIVFAGEDQQKTNQPNDLAGG